MKKKEKVPLTPMQKAVSQIRTAGIMAFVSAAITLFITIAAMGGAQLIDGVNILMLFDVALVVALGLLILLLKSRIAAIFMFCYYLFSQISMRIENPDMLTSGIFLLVIFIIAYFSGIIGTFSYHKLKKAEKENPDANIGNQNNEPTS